jgi:hypothetical protein
MRKYLDFEDDISWELSPLTYQEFERLGMWSGASDICFGEWLRHNGYHELEQLSPHSEPKDKPGIRLEPGEPEIKWDYLEELEDCWWL